MSQAARASSQQPNLQQRARIIAKVLRVQFVQLSQLLMQQVEVLVLVYCLIRQQPANQKEPQARSGASHWLLHESRQPLAAVLGFVTEVVV